ncbi:MAG: DUF2326 domain-containing protein [Bacteroidales bacterium]|jgi:hypothetical protein|nr:DUF2326 domain-containing protein [Bacteroidales bacterium]
MLIEIDCDLFRKSPISFHEGLNVILGDDVASNSIGKSTLLLIIDFAFGGDSYFSSENDSIRTLGHHVIRFCYKFGNKKMYFTRNTEIATEVSCCDAKYNKLSSITISDFRNILKDSYKLTQPDTTFRDIVGVFSRIWGKDNYYQHKSPMNSPHEKASIAINRLIKIFNKYDAIQKLIKEKQNIYEKGEAFKVASSKQIIPQITGVIYEQYGKEINSMSKDIDNITADITGVKTTYEAIVSEEVLTLRDEKSALIQKKNLYQEQLRKTQQNITTKNSGLNKQIEQIRSYFPNINMEKIETIDIFHTNITSILNEELKAREETLKELLVVCEKQIAELDRGIAKKLNMKDTPQYLRDRLVDLISKKLSYVHAMNLYDEREKLKNDLSAIDEQLKEVLNGILSEIAINMNNKMRELTELIYSSSKATPQINFEGNRYTFSSPDDTGTGKAYVNLITFDLSVLSLGNLPVIIHDSLLFKNIEIKILENIITVYQIFKKQIFIAIDEILRFSENTKVILSNNKVCSLSAENTLFNHIWNKESLDAH